MPPPAPVINTRCISDSLPQSDGRPAQRDCVAAALPAMAIEGCHRERSDAISLGCVADKASRATPIVAYDAAWDQGRLGTRHRRMEGQVITIVDVKAELAKLSMLKGRRPDMTEADRKGTNAFATLTPFRDGNLFSAKLDRKSTR